MNLFPTTFLLGIAGFDPSGAIAIITALAMGVLKRDIYIFAITTFIATLLMGIIGSFFIDTGVMYISGLLNHIPESIFMVLEFMVAIVLLSWFYQRVFLKSKKESKAKQKDSFFIKYIKKGLFIVALIFAIMSFTDPSFIALITLSSSDNILNIVLANIIWILISQAPVFILTIAVILNKHEKIITYLRNKFSNNPNIEKVRNVLSHLLSIVILFVSSIILLEATYYLFTNKWLI